MSDGSVSNPQARRTVNRRKSMSKAWASMQWKEAVKEFIEGKKCEWCGGTEKLLAHHPYQNVGDGVYSDLILSGCVCVCSKCHFMYHRRHKKICPVCHVGYRHLDTDMCIACWKKANPEVVARQEAAKAEHEQADRDKKAAQALKRKIQKSKSRCKFFRAGQKCGFRLGSKCPHAPTKAEQNCVDYQWRLFARAHKKEEK